MSDHVYNLVKKHHSVRKFKNKPLSEDVVKKLVEAGQSASTSSFLQAYSIIGIDDEKIKENLREVSGQPYVVENGYLFVFVIDYYRHHLVDQHAETDMENAYGSTEGNVITPDMYKRVMDLGVHCSVVGGAITRPKEITKRFVQVMED